MQTLASYNIKGGVGKTATAVNLAYLAAVQGRRVLLWDLDPQGAASFYFRIKPKLKGGSRKLLEGKRDIDELIKATDFPGLDLLPADFSYRHLDILLEAGAHPTRRLRKLTKPLASDYDLLLIDCPPSISLVSEAIFATADLLLVPVIPTTLSLRTLQQLNDFAQEQQLKKLQLRPFLSMVDRRKKLHRDLQQQLPEQWPELLQTSIPYASDIEKMGLERRPLPTFAPHSRPAQAYRELWQEVNTLLEEI